MRLIDADMKLCDLDEIKICVDRQYENCHGYSGSKKAIYREAILAVKSILHSAKPIDAVEVLRCRDCKYWGDEAGKLQHSDGVLFARCKAHNYLIDGRHTGWCPTENDFCSFGKRKEGAN